MDCNGGSTRIRGKFNMATLQDLSGAFHLERLRSDMTSGMRMKSFAELSARQRSVLD